MVQVNQCFNNWDIFGATHLSFPLEMESIILKRLISGERLKAKKIPIKQANSKGKVIYYTFIILREQSDKLFICSIEKMYFKSLPAFILTTQWKGWLCLIGCFRNLPAWVFNPLDLSGGCSERRRSREGRFYAQLSTVWTLNARNSHKQHRANQRNIDLKRWVWAHHNSAVR